MTKATIDDQLFAKSDEIRHFETEVYEAEFRLNSLMDRKSALSYLADIELANNTELKNDTQRKGFRADFMTSKGIGGLNFDIARAIATLAEHKADFRLAKREFDILVRGNSNVSV